MWPDRDEETCSICDVAYPFASRRQLSEQEAAMFQQQIEMLTDLIELGNGKTIQELHPEMNEKEHVERLATLLVYKEQM
jgi:hypothetical protein